MATGRRFPAEPRSGRHEEPGERRGEAPGQRGQRRNSASFLLPPKPPPPGDFPLFSPFSEGAAHLPAARGRVSHPVSCQQSGRLNWRMGEGGRRPRSAGKVFPLRGASETGLFPGAPPRNFGFSPIPPRDGPEEERSGAAGSERLVGKTAPKNQPGKSEFHPRRMRKLRFPLKQTRFGAQE